MSHLLRVLANPGEKKIPIGACAWCMQPCIPPHCRMLPAAADGAMDQHHVPPCLCSGMGSGSLQLPLMHILSRVSCILPANSGLEPCWGGGGVTRTPQTGDGALCWGGGAHPGCQTAPSGSRSLSLLQTRSPLLLPRPYRITQDKCKSLFVPEE